MPPVSGRVAPLLFSMVMAAMPVSAWPLPGLPVGGDVQIRQGIRSGAAPVLAVVGVGGDHHGHVVGQQVEAVGGLNLAQLVGAVVQADHLEQAVIVGGEDHVILLIEGRPVVIGDGAVRAGALGQLHPAVELVRRVDLGDLRAVAVEQDELRARSLVGFSGSSDPPSTLVVSSS